ncbi:Peptidoglycan-binding lysin domain protein [Paenibacillus curdlanolyticus YK9]|uniref:Peptidoglycan-binding lysin domain protein n=1 Tax=Paenibacillus curdlanolyticus YK9 TaxID=717606 RepID=E0IDW8_9BACL|nr:LysM peptidoglycan-binding domain-containing protein [Paenibacillus curdlanolyticus]EFM09322.1 Peptidoglycan-binding lysin domain protein [Paenibacillus curdlanolyticus YK9]
MKIHIVKRGDTLYLIAQKYNVSVDEILKLNPSITNADVIDVGMKVKIPSHGGSGGSHAGGGNGIMHQHVVKQGDTLWKLSKAWGVSLNDLIKANPQLTNPNVLLTGDIVNIPKPHGSHAEQIVHQMNMEPVQNGTGAGSGHGHFSPSSILNNVQGLAGKIPTGIMPGKKPTGKTPTAPITKTPTAPIEESKPEALAPIAPTPLPAPLPAPIPAPLPAPAPAPIVLEKTYPVHVEYHTQNVHLFQQCGIPAVEAGAVYGVPHMPEVLPAGQGYGYGHPVAGVADEHCDPWGNPLVGGAFDQGQGYGMPDVSPAQVDPAQFGYGSPTQLSPANIGPEHHGYNSPLVSPANVGPEHHGYDSPLVSPANVSPDQYGYGSPLVSPANVSPDQYGYGSPLVSPANAGPDQYGYGSPLVSPANVGPDQYGYGSPLLSPANVGPDQYGYGSPLVSPANVGPDQYGYGSPLLSPANVGPDQYGYGSPLVSPANVGPDQYGYGYGSPLVSPSMTDPFAAGHSSWPYGAYPTWPVQAAVADKSCGCQGKGREEESKAEVQEAEAAPAKTVKRNPPRKPAKKVSVRNVVPRPVEHRRSKPWINDN